MPIKNYRIPPGCKPLSLARLVPLRIVPESNAPTNRRGAIYYWSGQTLAALLTLLFLFLYGLEVYRLDYWRDYFFGDAIDVGKSCTVATVVGDNPETLPLGNPRPVKVPHPLLALGSVGHGTGKLRAHYHCVWPHPAELNSHNLTNLHVGWIFADRATVAVNGSERVAFVGNDKPVVPMTSADLAQPLLTIDIDVVGANAGRIGLAGAAPMVIAVGSTTNAKIYGVEVAIQSMRSLHDFLPSLTLAVILAIGWALGVRSRLMVAALFFLFMSTMHGVVRYLYDLWPWEVVLTLYIAVPFKMAMGSAFLTFGMEILGVAVRSIYRVMVATMIATAATIAILAFANDPHYVFQISNGLYGGLAACAACWLCIRGWQSTRRLPVDDPRRGLNKVFLALTAAFAAVTALDFVLEVSNLSGIRFSHHLNVLLPIFLGGSLLFHLARVESAFRLESSVRQSLADGLKAGASVQGLLRPKASNGSLGEFIYNFPTTSTGELSGEWAVVWPGESGFATVLCGKVIGLGPQAALAVAAIGSCLVDCRAAQLPLPAVFVRLNDRLFELFSGHLRTSACAVEDGKDGGLNLVVCGAATYIRLDATDALLPTTVSSKSPSSLGMAGDAEFVSHQVRIGERDSLLIFGDAITPLKLADGAGLLTPAALVVIARRSEVRGDIAGVGL